MQQLDGILRALGTAVNGLTGGLGGLPEIPRSPPKANGEEGVILVPYLGHVQNAPLHYESAARVACLPKEAIRELDELLDGPVQDPAEAQGGDQCEQEIGQEDPEIPYLPYRFPAHAD